MLLRYITKIANQNLLKEALRLWNLNRIIQRRMRQLPIIAEEVRPEVLADVVSGSLFGRSARELMAGPGAMVSKLIPFTTRTDLLLHGIKRSFQPFTLIVPRGAARRFSAISRPEYYPLYFPSSLVDVRRLYRYFPQFSKMAPESYAVPIMHELTEAEQTLKILNRLLGRRQTAGLLRAFPVETVEKLSPALRRRYRAAREILETAEVPGGHVSPLVRIHEYNLIRALPRAEKRRFLEMRYSPEFFKSEIPYTTRYRRALETLIERGEKIPKALRRRIEQEHLEATRRALLSREREIAELFRQKAWAR